MADAVLVGADPVAFAMAYVGADADLQAALGGTGRVGAYNTPPYPRIVASDPPGGFLREGRWLIGTAVQWEVLDGIDEPLGRQALKACYYALIAALQRLPEAPRDPDDPVITNVRFDGGGYSPIPGPQPRYVLTTVISSHPPQP